MRSFEFARKINSDGTVSDELAYPNAQPPLYGTKFSAGADFFCAEEVVVKSIWSSACEYIRDKMTGKDTDGFVASVMKPTLVHTGIKASMEDDEGLFLYNRSSNPARGLILSNGVGVIDKDYFSNKGNDGEIMFSFINIKPFPVTISVGDRVGQGVFQKVLKPQRGARYGGDSREGGFGSTGR